MVDRVKQLDISLALDVIKAVSIGLLDGLDGMLISRRPVEVFAYTSVGASTHNGGVDVV